MLDIRGKLQSAESALKDLLIKLEVPEAAHIGGTPEERRKAMGAGWR